MEKEGLPKGMKEALRGAVTEAIQAVGVGGFKKTSLFMSNERKV